MATPVDAPHTLPETSTVATLVVPLLHTPPPEASANKTDEPTQTVDEPVMVPAVGEPNTVTL